MWACLHNRCLWAAPHDKTDKIKARPLGQKNPKKQQQGNKMRVARRGRRRAEGWKDESGRKTIWEGKYLAIHLLERGCATHLCCSVCVCVLWNDNVWHTGAAVAQDMDSEGRERRWGEGERDEHGKETGCGEILLSNVKVWKPTVLRKSRLLNKITLTCNAWVYAGEREQQQLGWELIRFVGRLQNHNILCENCVSLRHYQCYCENEQWFPPPPPHRSHVSTLLLITKGWNKLHHLFDITI